ncbi:MAG: cyclopropane-fatty-acyl-phospholipid synthase family protein [Bacteroidia bacterium]
MKLIENPCDPATLDPLLWKPAKQKDGWFSKWFSSPYYPILYKKRDFQEAEAFIALALEKLALSPRSKVLDLACGRGRHARFLRQFGHSVSGYDLSKESISDANRFSDEELHFYVHDMRQPFPHRDFDAVLNLFTSFGYFQDVRENCVTFLNIAKATKPGGYLVLDYLNATEVIANLVTSESFNTGDIAFKIRRYVEKGRVFKHIAIQDGEHFEEHTEAVQLLSHQYFTQTMAEVGYTVIEEWGDYKGNAFEPDISKRLIIVAQKN